MNLRPCRIEGCDGVAGRPGAALGYCSKHYNRLRRTGDPLLTRADLKPKHDGLCSITGCSKPRWARALCSMHLMRLRAHGDPGTAERRWFTPSGTCQINGCDKPVRNGKRGWCQGHYLRWHRYGNPLAGAPSPDPERGCLVDACQKKHYGRGYCRVHYTLLLMQPRRHNAPGNASPNQVLARIAYWGNRCWMCHGPWTDLDHVKPVAAGGPNWPANLRPACKDCNSRKNARWFGPQELARFQ